MTSQYGWDSIFSRKDHIERDPHPWLAGFLDCRPAGGRLLDLGCGTGPNFPAARQAGHKVYGSDIAISGLRKAQVQMRATGINVPLVLADMTALPFQDNRFDTVVSIQTINHGTPEDIGRTVNEITRILKPGGHIFITIARAHNTYPRGSYTLIEPHTVIPLRGPEKGMVHHFFTGNEVLHRFSSFEIEPIVVDPFDKWLIKGRKKTSWI